jgi:hypothetical protein
LALVAAQSNRETTLVAQVPSEGPTGVIVGTVRESVYGALPGVTITLSGAPFDRLWATVTKLDGSFRLDHLPDGSFTLTAGLAGFKTVTRTTSISHAERLELGPIALEPGTGVGPMNVNLGPLGLKPDEIPVALMTSLGLLGLALNRDAPAETDVFFKRIDEHLYDGGNIEPYFSVDRGEATIQGLELIEHSPSSNMPLRPVLMKNDALLDAVTDTKIGRLWNWNNSGDSNGVVHTIFQTPLVSRSFSPRVTISRASRAILMFPSPSDRVR